MEEVCWGLFDLRCRGEAPKSCQLWDFYLLLLFHGGSSEVRGDMECVKPDYMDPRVVAKGTEAKAVYAWYHQRGEGLEAKWRNPVCPQGIAQLVATTKTNLQELGSLSDD